MDHPPVSVEPPLPSRPNGSEGVPQVLDGAVYLPAGKPVEAESEEFESLLRKHLPPEIAADVMGQWRGVSRHATRLQWIVSVVCLLTAFGLLFHFFPKTRFDGLKEHEGMEIRDLSGPLPFNSPYRSDCNKAEREYKEGKYDDVRQTLENSVNEIIRTKNRNADRVLYLYFDALRKLDNRGSSEAVSLLTDLIQQDPKTLRWRQFKFELSPKICRVLNYGQVYKAMSTPDGRERIDGYLNDVKYTRDHLNELKRKCSKAELERLRETLDIYRVKLLISCWLLKGYKAGKAALPDDEGDPGVDDREDALRIALKHDATSSCKDFWQARLFIAKTLCKQDDTGWKNRLKLNQTYWNGRYLLTKADLRNEIDYCNKRINGEEQ